MKEATTEYTASRPASRSGLQAPARSQTRRLGWLSRFSIFGSKAAAPKWMRAWMWTCALSSGFFALLWLLLRSGPKPSRLAYPCQQAALSAATLAFGAPLVATFLAVRRRVVEGLCTPTGAATAALGLTLTVGLWGTLSRADVYRGPQVATPPEYQAQVFHVSNCPQEPIGSRFVGLDNLISLMGREGLKLYQSATESLVSGPQGIIAADDVVVIKINYQWPERGGSNVDVLRGLVKRIVEHPDTFTGEIVVCENSQFNSIQNFDFPNNNAQNISLSPHDVVTEYAGLGFKISHYDWTSVRNTSVAEFTEGDLNDGYVVYAYDSQFGGRISYPKFRSDSSTYISIKEGIWDRIADTYDREKLKFINLPVLKSHHATYGATACVKHYMGLVTGLLSTNSHSAIGNGIMGALLGEIQLADLNILDSIWVNANPYNGPWTLYSEATRRDELIASVDPVAADIWGVSNILIPAFESNGYSPPWPYPSADPYNPSSSFRNYLDNSMNFMLAAGYDVTNDLQRIDLFSWNGAGDFDQDSVVDLDDYDQFELCFTGPDAGPLDPGCEPGDFDLDGDIDCGDWDAFVAIWMGPGDPPALPACSCVVVPYGDFDGSGSADLDDLLLMLEGLSGIFETPGVGFDELDCFPCDGGDADLNLRDLVALLDTLGGAAPCADSCL